MSEWLWFATFAVTIVIVWFASKFYYGSWQHDEKVAESGLVADIMNVGDDMVKLINEHVFSAEAVRLLQEWDQLSEEVCDMFNVHKDEDNAEIVDEEDDDEEEWR
jgi:hypothetical protein